MSAKLEDGDFRGAVRLACSEDCIADMDPATFAALQAKHPPPHPLSSIPPPLDVDPAAVRHISFEAVFSAIRSFPNGSAGGPDGLRPQHLRDLTGPSANEGSHRLITALTSFTKLVLEGRTPPSIRLAFFGASLIALKKKGRGFTPIAVGSPLRKLAAKVASGAVREEMSTLLAPTQLGFGVRGGVEAAIHAARQYLHLLPPDYAIIKLDFSNAFNSVCRDKMLSAVLDLAPEPYQFVYSAYSAPSSLYWGDKILFSQEGIQQVDPLALFCFALPFSGSSHG